MRYLKFLLIFLLCLAVAPIFAQRLAFSSYEQFRAALDQAVETDTVDAFWDGVVADSEIPLAFLDGTAVFLYRGAGDRVEWRGDFTGWDASPDFVGERVGETDIWVLVREFPPQARLDYKIVIDETEWILDPLNPNQQMGGFGPNSELRMPMWAYPKFTLPSEGGAKGKLSPDQTIYSRKLGYAVNIRVYTPADYAAMDDLPVIYVTDGQEYADQPLGSMVTSLDNLIANESVQPIIAVFIDPRSSEDTSTNRRESEYIINPTFAEFLAAELVPTVDAVYDTARDADQRAILGTSLGGLNSVYVGLNHAAVFGLVGVQSPALWAGEEVGGMDVVGAYRDADTLPIKVFLSQGTIWDDHENTYAFRDVLEAKEYEFEYVEIPEGHSWGNWRALIDDVLIYFFPAQS